MATVATIVVKNARGEEHHDVIEIDGADLPDLQEDSWKKAIGADVAQRVFEIVGWRP